LILSTTYSLFDPQRFVIVMPTFNFTFTIIFRYKGHERFHSIYNFSQLLQPFQKWWWSLLIEQPNIRGECYHFSNNWHWKNNVWILKIGVYQFLSLTCKQSKSNKELVKFKTGILVHPNRNYRYSKCNLYQIRKTLIKCSSV